MNQPEQYTITEFGRLVNMSAPELKIWLKTKESNAVGWTSTGRKTSESREESVGHESGRMIVAILNKPQNELNQNDFVQMRRVTAFIKRHLGQGPTKQPIETSRWRYSLMNWGHDPLNDI